MYNILKPKLKMNKKATIYLQSLHKSLRSTLGDGSQVIDEICLGHANPSVDDRQSTVVFVGNKLDLKIFSAVQLRRVSQTLVPNFIQGLNEKEFTVRKAIPENWKDYEILKKEENE